MPVAHLALRPNSNLTTKAAHYWFFAMFLGRYFPLKKPRDGTRFLAGRSMKTTTTGRNRGIFASFRAGKTVSQLAVSYGLAPATIASIVATEKHKLEVSADEFYRCLRRSPESQP